MFSQRSVAFVLGGVTVYAWVIFLNGLVRPFAINHPDARVPSGIITLT